MRHAALAAVPADPGAPRPGAPAASRPAARPAVGDRRRCPSKYQWRRRGGAARRRAKARRRVRSRASRVRCRGRAARRCGFVDGVHGAACLPLSGSTTTVPCHAVRSRWSATSRSAAASDSASPNGTISIPRVRHALQAYRAWFRHAWRSGRGRSGVTSALRKKRTMRRKPSLGGARPSCRRCRGRHDLARHRRPVHGRPHRRGRRTVPRAPSFASFASFAPARAIAAPRRATLHAGRRATLRAVLCPAHAGDHPYG
jgi:hypothetical protein